MKNFRVLTVMAIVAMLGFGTYSFAADRANRSGKNRGWLKNCPAAKNLGDEERQKVLDQIKVFRNDANAVRQQIRQKRIELKSEMKKPSTDSQKAFALQKEISDLKAQIAQKRIQHLLNLKTINPSLSECMERGSRGAVSQSDMDADE